jgi:glutamate carboxypeptidase
VHSHRAAAATGAVSQAACNYARRVPPADDRLARLPAWLRARADDITAEVADLVRRESPTGDADRLDALAAHVAGAWGQLGARSRSHRVAGVGTHLEVRWDGGAPPDRAPALLLGHLDTVHAVGTATGANPVRVDDGRVYGPGSQDMKAGLVLARCAVAALAALGIPPARPVVLLATADEETGSSTSRAHVERLARAAAHCLVLEPAGDDGAVKTARKGVAIYELEVAGRAAHAGMHFDEGVNAAVALAALVGPVAGLTDGAAGTTVNVGTLRAGTRVNVVPDRARADVEARFTTNAEAARVDAALRGLRVAPPARLSVRGGVNRRALERDAGVAALYERAQAATGEVGLGALPEQAAGGASDGNFAAAVGCPTLDGLGAIGAGLHTTDEWVALDRLPERAALVAALLASA